MKVDMTTHIVDAGFTIVRITENETNSEYSWWIASEFREANPALDEPINHHFIRGFEITDWIKNYSMIQSRMDFINKLQTYLDKEETEEVTMTFSIRMLWKRYSKAR